MKKIKKILGIETKEEKSFNWSAISSREQKKIVKDAISGSNKLQRNLYKKARSI